MAYKQSWFLASVEGIRMIRELVEFKKSIGALKTTLPHGKKHIMVLPGFLSNDTISKPMLELFSSLGHSVVGWGCGRNTGYSKHLEDTLVDSIKRLTDTVQQPITLVGHSLGGTMACGLARNLANEIDNVITMGSPIHGDMYRCHPAKIYEFVTKDSIRDMEHKMDGLLDINAKLRCIYSENDGVVPPDICSLPPNKIVDGLKTNHQVNSSHCGMVYNTQVMQEIAKLLKD